MTDPLIDKDIADAHFKMINVGMKIEQCVGCGVDVEVGDDYEPEGCCSGSQCGCMGMQIKPVVCDACHSKYFGAPVVEKPHP